MYFVEIGHQCKSRNLSLTFCIIMSLFCLHNTMQLMLFRCWKTGRSNIKHMLAEKLSRGLGYTIQCNDSIASFTMETDWHPSVMLLILRSRSIKSWGLWSDLGGGGHNNPWTAQVTLIPQKLMGEKALLLVKINAMSLLNYWHLRNRSTPFTC